MVPLIVDPQPTFVKYPVTCKGLRPRRLNGYAGSNLHLSRISLSPDIDDLKTSEAHHGVGMAGNVLALGNLLPVHGIFIYIHQIDLSLDFKIPVFLDSLAKRSVGIALRHLSRSTSDPYEQEEDRTGNSGIYGPLSPQVIPSLSGHLRRHSMRGEDGFQLS